MIILGIESSCDETAVAIVEDGKRVLSNTVASQMAKHAATGGVVPEVASREHMKAILPVLRQSFEEADLMKGGQPDWSKIDAIAVTKEPGLVGSLLVGQITAQTLAFVHEKPLIEVNHIHGHMLANWLDIEDEVQFPVLILTVSGGHNELVLMRDFGQFEVLGESLDDAAGEAFDKVARLLGVGYPGGPAIEKLALHGNKEAHAFPVSDLEDYNFSFSGLKTAVLYYLQKHEERMGDPNFLADTAACFQKAVIEALVQKVLLAVDEYCPKEVHLTGGVSANKALRAAIQERAEGVTFRHPQKMSYCTDNAAMIAGAAYFLKDIAS